jgi:hypothetical protein
MMLEVEREILGVPPWREESRAIAVRIAEEPKNVRACRNAFDEFCVDRHGLRKGATSGCCTADGENKTQSRDHRIAAHV